MISQSDLIRPGRPAVYQLTPKAHDIGTLKRLTIGEKNFTKTNKTILLVGETGTGKSTLINALVNYTMGGKFEDEVWFKIVAEEEKSQTESQTSDVIVYEIFGFEDKTLLFPFSLTIVDTPGFGDTRGKEYDAIINRRLLDLFESKDGVHEMTAVCLVLKASENRVSDRMRYIFDSVMSLFGKDMEKNIIALMTHSDGRTPKNALQALLKTNVKCAKNEKNQPVHFLFNNCQEDLRDEDNEWPLENAWRLSTRGMQGLSEFLEKTGSQELKTTVEVLKSQIRLTASIHNLQERIKSTEKMNEDIEKTKMQLKLHEIQLENDKNFTIEVDESSKELEKYGAGWSWFSYDGVTRCETCQENCHYPCTDAWAARFCTVMGTSTCNVCKCSVSQHVKDRHRYVIKTKKVKTSVEELKKKFQADVNDTAGLLGALDGKKKENEENIKQLVEEAFSHVLKLRDSALTVKTMSTQAYLGVLIKKMREFGKMEEVQILEEMDAQMDMGSKSLLARIFG
ncbi:uncharacterized protein LOC133419781 [Cololabis saira]|uniref:uncharacterized protein LOC133419781 n=1 Tax=Cololabis saira TaxID=129043 RepID=UPI002AD3FCC1|nr:uncharacterized protein LOC133419781 [Cololabis saira]